NPDLVAIDYVKAGADILTFHVEAARHAHRIIQTIHAEGAKAGIAINPGTAIETLYPLIPYVDVIMLMSVNPGFGGQKFIQETCRRIQLVSHAINAAGRVGEIQIEVDGGITDKTISMVKEAGATAVVAGSYVYGAIDRKQAIQSLK
ncbi:ribulose-phosphate 3-epimerase, partial [Dolichospermum sp. ST_sed1]|nr:ribulose-phosphate 3-epimerase [Dolichospermum sp. ST_sed1]